MQAETLKVEVDPRFIFEGMLLKGDCFDSQGKLIIEKNKPITAEQIHAIRAQKIDGLYYYRTGLKLKKAVVNPMISEESFLKAYALMEDINLLMLGNQLKLELPSREINSVVKNFIDEIRDHGDACLSLLEMLEDDEYTYTHSINVSTIAIMISVSMKLDDESTRCAGIAGLLHDIGKTMIPKPILMKSGKLSEEEWRIIRNHPIFSYKIIRNQEGIGDTVAKSVLWHHERFQGGGYPFGVSHHKVNLISQLLMVADIFDALTSRRPYKPALPFDEAFTYLMENSGSMLNPAITQVFLRDAVKAINGSPLYPVNSYVLLNSGEFAVVKSYNKNEFSLRPQVLIFSETKEGNKEVMLKYPKHVDLEKDLSRRVVRRITDPLVIARYMGMCSIQTEIFNMQPDKMQRLTSEYLKYLKGGPTQAESN